MPDHDTPCQAIRATIMGNSEDSLMPITESFWARRINSDRYEVCDVLYLFPLVAGDQVVITKCPIPTNGYRRTQTNAWLVHAGPTG